MGKNNADGSHGRVSAAQTDLSVRIIFIPCGYEFSRPRKKNGCTDKDSMARAVL